MPKKRGVGQSSSLTVDGRYLTVCFWNDGLQITMGIQFAGRFWTVYSAHVFIGI